LLGMKRDDRQSAAIDIHEGIQRQVWRSEDI